MRINMWFTGTGSVVDAPGCAQRSWEDHRWRVAALQPRYDGFREGYHWSAGSEGIERGRVRRCVESVSLASHSPIRVTDAIRLGSDSNETFGVKTRTSSSLEVVVEAKAQSRITPNFGIYRNT